MAGPAETLNDVICTCLINEQFHPVEASGIAGKNAHLVPVSWSNPWQEPLSLVQKLLEETGLSCQFRDFRMAGLSLDTAKEQLSALNDAYDHYAQTQMRLEQQIEENTHEVQDLQKFAGLPSDLTDIYHLDYVRFRFGRMLREAFDSLNVKLGEKDEVILYSESETS